MISSRNTTEQNEKISNLKNSRSVSRNTKDSYIAGNSFKLELPFPLSETQKCELCPTYVTFLSFLRSKTLVGRYYIERTSLCHIDVAFTASRAF